MSTGQETVLRQLQLGDLHGAYTGWRCKSTRKSTGKAPEARAFLGMLEFLVAVKKILMGRHGWTALPVLGR
jgi:hypothetical protein